MAEVPGTDWTGSFRPDDAGAAAPLPAAWRVLPGHVRHVFTHFPLELTVFRADVTAAMPAPAGCRWTPRLAVGEEALPNLMRKVLAHAGIEIAPLVASLGPAD